MQPLPLENYAARIVCGVYRIVCLATGEFYVGSSHDIKDRWRKHRNLLRKGRHKNGRLQRAFSLHGESGLAVEVAEETSPGERLAREQSHLDGIKQREDRLAMNVCETANAPYDGPARRYLITNPAGERFRLKNLAAFCRQHGLNRDAMYVGGCNGWACVPLEWNRRAGRRAFRRLVVLHPDGVTEEAVANINEFCRRHGLKRSPLEQVARSLSDQYRGFRCWPADSTRAEWEACCEARRGRSRGESTWRVTTPSGDNLAVRNLKRFCKENGLSFASLYQGGWNGWRATKERTPPIAAGDAPAAATTRGFVVTRPDGAEEVVADLLSFAREHSLSRTLLELMARGGLRQHKGFRCRPEGTTKEEWEAIVPPPRGAAQSEKGRKARRGWLLVRPDGTEVRLKSLHTFCKENGLSEQALGRVARGFARHHKQWRCRQEGTSEQEWEATFSANRLPNVRTTYAVTAPDGTFFRTTNLKAFSREYGLPRRAMRKVAAGEVPDYEGWRVQVVVVGPTTDASSP